MNRKFHPLAALLGALAGIVFAYATAATVAGTVHTAGRFVGADMAIHYAPVAPAAVLFQIGLIVISIVVPPALIAVAYRARRLIPLAWVAAAVLPALAIALRAFGLSAAGAVTAFFAVVGLEFAVYRVRPDFFLHLIHPLQVDPGSGEMPGRMAAGFLMMMPPLAVIAPPLIAAGVFLPPGPTGAGANDMAGLAFLSCCLLAAPSIIRHAGFRRPVFRKGLPRQAAQGIGERVRDCNRKKALWVAAGMSAGALPVALRILRGEGIAPHGGLAFGLVMERVAVAGAVGAGVAIMAIAGLAMGAFDAGTPIFPADSGNADRTIKGARTEGVQEALDALDGDTPAPQVTPQVADRSTTTIRGAHTTHIQDRLDALDSAD